MARRKKKTENPEVQEQQGAKPNPDDSNPGDNPDTDSTGEASTSNDLQWYMKIPQLMQDAASVVWAWVAGMFYNIKSRKTTKGDNATFVTPGFMAVYTRPNLPRTVNPSDTLNAVGMQEFTYLRSTVSSRLPYDAPELVMVNIAIANVMAFINFLARVYALAFLIDNENRYTPKSMLEAMGIQWESVVNDLANFRYKVNYLIQQVSTLAIPKDIAYLAREASLYSSIYQDGTSVKDQMYFYTPESFFVYSDNADGKGTPGLVLKRFWNMDDQVGANRQLNSQSLYTVQELVTFGQEMIQGLFNSEAVATISANTVRAFGPEGVVTLSYLEENTRIVPIFDIVILEQMKNATIMPYELNNSQMSQNLFNSWNLTQSINDNEDPAWWLEFDPYFTVPITGWNESVMPAYALEAITSYKKILTTTTGYTDPSIVIESSRLMTTGTQDIKGSNYEFRLVGGAEIAMAAYMAKFQQSDPGSSSQAKVTGFTRIDSYNQVSAGAETTGVAQNLALIWQMAMKRSFRFAPSMFITTDPTVRDGADQADMPSGWNDPVLDFDLDNFALITPEELSRLHETAFYSMLFIDVTNRVGYSHPQV